MLLISPCPDSRFLRDCKINKSVWQRPYEACTLQPFAGMACYPRFCTCSKFMEGEKLCDCLHGSPPVGTERGGIRWVDSDSREGPLQTPRRTMASLECHLGTLQPDPRVGWLDLRAIFKRSPFSYSTFHPIMSAEKHLQISLSFKPFPRAPSQPWASFTGRTCAPCDHDRS